MRKLFALLTIFILSVIVAALYGLLHDQLTYTLSPEYYTKFKFIQFGLSETGEEAIFSDPRAEVSIVGVMATWWMGIPIGLILGITAFFRRNWRDMVVITLKSFPIIIGIAFTTGLIGLIYGYYQASHDLKSFTKGWYIPNDLREIKDFVAVGSMHNFSYIGGLLGCIFAIIYMVRKRSPIN